MELPDRCKVQVSCSPHPEGLGRPGRGQQAVAGEQDNGFVCGVTYWILHASWDGCCDEDSQPLRVLKLAKVITRAGKWKVSLALRYVLHQPASGMQLHFGIQSVTTGQREIRRWCGEF